MNAGDLDRRITVQRCTEAPDSFGQVIPTWSTLAVVWAKVERNGGGEKFATDQRTSRSEAAFTIRYRAGITPKMRVLFDGEVWEIEAVDELGRRDGLMLKCHAFAVQSGP